MGAAGAGPIAVAPRQVRVLGYDLWFQPPGAGTLLKLDDVEGVLHILVRVDACRGWQEHMLVNTVMKYAY